MRFGFSRTCHVAHCENKGNASLQIVGALWVGTPSLGAQPVQGALAGFTFGLRGKRLRGKLRGLHFN